MSAESPLRDRNGPAFDLIETLRWEPDAGFVRLERHLARLGVSAAELGFRHDRANVRRALSAAVADATESLRIRLVLDRAGHADVSAQALVAPQPSEWRLRIAGRRLDSADPLLRHKTSRRESYLAARAEFTQDEADEVLLLNERGEVCEGTITNLFLDMGDGMLVTPALQCGLLPGVLRGELLNTGRACEKVILPAQLEAAARLFVGNSLRGLMPARLL